MPTILIKEVHASWEKSRNLPKGDPNAPEGQIFQ